MASMARAMGALLWERENCMAKIKSVIYSFLNLELAPHTTIKQQSYINAAPSCNARRVAPAPSISVL